MRVRDLTTDDYPLICHWWRAWGHPVIARDDLPPRGLLAESDGRPIIVAFLVGTEAYYAFVTTVVSDHESTGQERELGIQALLAEAEARAKRLGYRKLIIVPEKPRLRDKIVSSGFFENPEKVFLCVKEF